MLCVLFLCVFSLMLCVDGALTLDVRAFHLRSLTLDIVKIYLYEFSDTFYFTKPSL